MMRYVSWRLHLLPKRVGCIFRVLVLMYSDICPIMSPSGFLHYLVYLKDVISPNQISQSFYLENVIALTLLLALSWAARDAAVAALKP